MFSTSDKNPINTNLILKELQKQMKELQTSIRQIFSEIRNRKKGENISKFLSVEEVADTLSLHKSTVYRMIYTDKLRTTRINRKLFIHESEILDILNDKLRS
ncbi:helix-turn-helix domain-containing protein [Albibacterium profundi]|uniref:Helix-turn-helix domain-containing protein n=1 Tax=Albibacterium profundi TaxID=3134906 RepID=A0ABV5C9N2_9SPHI